MILDMGMKAVSLFSGVGGFEIGFDRAGIETVLQVELDSHCQSVLERHWPETERVSDVRDVHGQWRERAECNARSIGSHHSSARGSHIDLSYGGFPCQPFSVAGKRAGDRDDRNLWPEFERVLRELRPRWAVIENVPGLLSIDNGRFFGGVLDSLGNLGFDGVAYAVLDAQHFGVPQRRRRVFIVGGPSRQSVEQVLSICEGCEGHPAESGTTGEGIAGTLGGGSTESGRGFRNDLDSHGAYVVFSGGNSGDSYGIGYTEDGTPPLKSAPSGSNQVPVLARIVQPGGQTGKGDGVPLVAAPLRSRSSLNSNMPERGGEDDENLITIASTVEASDGRKWGSNQRVDRGKALVVPELAYAAREAKGISLLESQTNYIPSESQVRRLTPLECERLMGWPDDWTRFAASGSEISDTHRYRMIGNGVVAPVAEWIGRRVVAIDRYYRESFTP